MRISLNLTPNTETVPFNYQSSLVGAFHKWLGENELHDGLSLYSLSWLSHGQRRKDGLDFPEGSTFSVSAPSDELLSALVHGVFKGHQIRWGMEVREVIIQRTPDFGSRQKFFAQSPILIKRKPEDAEHHQYYFPSHKESGPLMTETLRLKMEKAGIEGDISVRFDETYPNPKIKMVSYKGINIKAALCPVLVEGDPRAVQFAWEVGIGNSTGIGFGCLK